MSIWKRLRGRPDGGHELAWAQATTVPIRIAPTGFTPVVAYDDQGRAPTWMRGEFRATYAGGREDLEVVGESHYQPALRHACGYTGERVRHQVHAILLPEIGNPYDAQSVSVWAEGNKVGYLPRDEAESLRPFIIDLASREQAPVVVDGQVVGGGQGRSLGIWLKYDPVALGMKPAGSAPGVAHLRTGLTEANFTDEADDSYDLSALASLPDDSAKRLPKLRKLLAVEDAPIARHFIMNELETCTYALRDAFPEALEVFDRTCVVHDQEMTTIRPALLEKFDALPLLGLYRQSSIRHTKAKDLETALWWAERGIQVYAGQAHNQDWVSDLQQRAEKLSRRVGLAPAQVRHR